MKTLVLVYDNESINEIAVNTSINCMVFDDSYISEAKRLDITPIKLFQGNLNEELSDYNLELSKEIPDITDFKKSHLEIPLNFNSLNITFSTNLSLFFYREDYKNAPSIYTVKLVKDAKWK